MGSHCGQRTGCSCGAQNHPQAMYYSRRHVEYRMDQRSHNYRLVVRDLCCPLRGTVAVKSIGTHWQWLRHHRTVGTADRNRYQFDCLSYWDAGSTVGHWICKRFDRRLAGRSHFEHHLSQWRRMVELWWTLDGDVIGSVAGDRCGMPAGMW